MNKIIGFVLVLICSVSQAHFTHFEPRIIHIYQQGADVVLLMRMPLPLVMLDDNWTGMDSRLSLPYSQLIETSEGADYFLDHQELYEDLSHLEARIFSGYEFRKNGVKIQTHSTRLPQQKQSATQHQGSETVAILDSVHIFNTDSRKPFNSLSSAQDNFTGRVSIEPDAIKLFDAGIDLAVRLTNTSIQDDEVGIRSALGERFNAIHRLANLVSVHRSEGVDGALASTTETEIGVLDYRSTRQASGLEQAGRGFYDGLVHILIGLDHVVFVILLYFCASSVGRLIALATAFTLGHSFSLVFGQGAFEGALWFVPGIELVIAATIAGAAVALLLNRQTALGTTPVLILGIIHGFGFSFVFGELESAGATTSLANLLGFNLGIEAGQVLIYLILFAVSRTTGGRIVNRLQAQRYTAAAALLISCYWIISRAAPLLDALV